MRAILYFMMAFPFTASAYAQTADLVLLNGNVITLAKSAKKISAVAVAHDRIIATGTDSEMRKLVDAHTRVIDLGGKTMTPGLTDSHLHMVRLGQSLYRPNFRTATSEENAVAILREKLPTIRQEQWILGRGWDQNKWPGQEFPGAKSLDQLKESRPIVLRRVDGHVVWVNTKAMQVAGINDSTPDPAGGKIVRDSQGHATGIFIDQAMELIEKHIPDQSDAEIEIALNQSFQEVLRYGLTTVHDADMDRDTYRVLQKVAQKGQLPVRVYALAHANNKIGKLDSDEQKFVAELLKSGPQIETYNKFLTLRGFKLFADGALGSRGALLSHPYEDDAQNVGLIQFTKQELIDFATKATQAGFQVATHAIGDAANHTVLDAFEEVFKKYPTKTSPRFRIEHAQILQAKDIPRFAKLGVIPSMQTTHCTSDMAWVHSRIGERRAKEGAYAWQALLKSGAKIANGSDAPVESANPMLGLYSAITRKDLNGQPLKGWHSENKMTRVQALKSFTIDAAYAAFEEDFKGSIEVGKLADFTVLSSDILKVPEGKIPSVRAEMTIVGGKVAYDLNHPVLQQAQ